MTVRKPRSARWKITIGFGQGAKSNWVDDPIVVQSMKELRVYIEANALPVGRAFSFYTADRYNEVKASNKWIVHGNDMHGRRAEHYDGVKFDYAILDIDKAEVGSIDATLERLAAADLAVLLYPSTGNMHPVKESKECFRVIVPLTVPTDAAGLLKATAYIAERYIAAEVDPCSKDPYRLMYMPTSRAKIYSREGLALNVPLDYQHSWGTAASLVTGDADWSQYEPLRQALLEIDGARMSDKGIKMPSQSGREFTNGRNADDAWLFMPPRGAMTQMGFESQHKNAEPKVSYGLRAALEDAGCLGVYLKCLNGTGSAPLTSFAGKKRVENQVAVNEEEEPEDDEPEDDEPEAPPSLVVDGEYSDRDTILDKNGFISTAYDTDEGIFSDRRDKQRFEIIRYRPKMRMFMIPPDVTIKTDKNGVFSGYKANASGDNLRWMLEKLRLTIAYNVMTDDVDLLDAKTLLPLQLDADQIRSRLLSELERHGMPDKAFDNHFSAEAKRKQYHPVDLWLSNGGEWDGVKRFDRVMDCVPCADPELMRMVMRGVCVAAVSMLDITRRHFSLKYAPVLHSEANNWHKTAFIRRLFDVAPGTFLEGMQLDPDNKDSVKQATAAWGVELGELESTLSSKRDSGPVKAFIGKSEEVYRAAFARTETKRARRTVFVGSVNHNDFITDSTTTSRFPVIELTDAVDIDAVNDLLGWEYRNSTLALADAEQLRQFWLEVKTWADAGEGWELGGKVTARIQDTGKRFTRMSEEEQSLRDYITAKETRNLLTDMTASQVLEKVGSAAKSVVKMGKALSKMAKEGLLSSRIKDGVRLYTFVG